MTKVIYDIETDALLHDATKVHCVVMKVWHADRFGIFVSENHVAEVNKWLRTQGYIQGNLHTAIRALPFSKLPVGGLEIIAHNQLCFDLHILKKFFDLNWIENCKIFDTLVMSRYMYSGRKKHGLESWGKILGPTKKKIHDWKNQSLEDYIERCVRDVVINERLYDHLQLNTSNHKEGLRLAYFVQNEMFRQEETGVVFDKSTAEKLLITVQSEMDEISKAVEPEFGKAPLPKSQQPTLPKRPFKKDGSFSQAALKYCQKVGLKDPCELLHLLQNNKPVILTQQITLDNIAHVKEYLYSKLNWKPVFWRTNDITHDNSKNKENASKKYQRARKYVKDTWASPYCKTIWDMLQVPEDLRVLYDDLDEDKHARAVYFVIKNGRNLPMSPQYCVPGTKSLCPNLKKLKGETAKKIVTWMSLKNRRGVITGWINHPRLQIDGRLPAGASGITNTHRQRHTCVVNVPKAKPDILYGQEMRSLFVTPKDWSCVGCDAAGLENRVAAHFSYPYDYGEYAKEVLEGDTHQKNSEAYTRAIGKEVSRSDSKPITYGILYGASGKKVAKMLEISLDLGNALVEAFWNANEGLKSYRQYLEAEWLASNKSYISGLDGRRIETRSKHSIVNAAFQSAGAVLMDRAWRIAYDDLDTNLYQRWGYFHDEYQLYVKQGFEDYVGKILVDSIKKAGEFYRLNVPLDGEYMVGKNWAEVH